MMKKRVFKHAKVWDIEIYEYPITCKEAHIWGRKRVILGEVSYRALAVARISPSFESLGSTIGMSEIS